MTGFHDKFQPCYKSRSSGFWCVAPGFGLLGTELSANRGKSREGLWYRFVWANRAAALHLQYRYFGTESLQELVWEPKGDRVTYEGKDKAGNPVKVTYVRSQLNNQPDNVKKEIDPSFVNDQYWLIFPFHTSWDTAATVEDTGIHRLPLGSGSARRVVVKYPSDGGYTPGDTWELYVGPDNRVQELVFHHGGNANPGGIVATWAGYKKAGPLLISTDHRGTRNGKPFRLTFTDVAVKLAASDTSINAQ